MAAKEAKRIEGLDGLRACAIGFVILGHLSANPGLPDWVAPVHWFLGVTDLAGLGVRLFFVLSGFIITHLLLAEEQQVGSISLVRFWLRRSLRILPPLAGYLITIAALSGIVPSIQPLPVEYWMATTFTWLLLSSHGTWFLGHTWSLSIEEQFYIIWPCIFIAAKACRFQSLVFVSLIILPLATALSQWLVPDRYAWLLPANGCYLAAGCILAMLRFAEHPWLTRYRTAPKARVFSIALLLIILPLLLLRVSSQLASLAPIFGAVGLSFIVYVCIEDQGTLKRLLQFRPMVLVGTLSYSLYLWQQLFLGRFGTEWWQSFPQNLVFMAITSVLAHLLLERPFFGLRQRLRHRMLEAT